MHMWSRVKGTELQKMLKSSFFIMKTTFLSDHNFVSNEGNLIISFVIERY